MHQDVVDFFPEFTKRLEGEVFHMYLDCLGYVTIGYGCLIDPVSLATQLPFVLKGTETPATTQQIIDEWHRIKDNVRLAKMHYKYTEPLCQLRITQKGALGLLAKRLNLFEADLKKEFPEWELWTADAQLCCMSMSWAMGSGYTHTFKNFTKACKEHRFIDAAELAHINEKGNVGIIPRNKINKELAQLAAYGYGPTVIEGYDRTKVSRKDIGF